MSIVLSLLLAFEISLAHLVFLIHRERGGEVLDKMNLVLILGAD